MGRLTEATSQQKHASIKHDLTAAHVNFLTLRAMPIHHKLVCHAQSEIRFLEQDPKTFFLKCH